MHIHLSHGFDQEIVDQFLGDYKVTNGGEAPSNTKILVDGHPSADLIASLPSLKVIIIPFAGLVPRTRSVILANPHLAVYNLHHNAAATAEKAIEMMMTVAKQTVVNDGKMRQGKWCPRFDKSDAIELNGKTVLIFGFGSIGKRVGSACAGLGMNVIGISRGNRNQLMKFAPQADVLVACAPLTPETECAINQEFIEQLPQSAIVVNVGRGNLIDEESLYAALSKGNIHGAGLDVWWQYPSEDPDCAPSSFPFWELPNVVMSPHCGGTVRETEPARFKALRETIIQIFAGSSTIKRVDPNLGY